MSIITAIIKVNTNCILGRFTGSTDIKWFQFLPYNSRIKVTITTIATKTAFSHYNPPSPFPLPRKKKHWSTSSYLINICRALKFENHKMHFAAREQSQSPCNRSYVAILHEQSLGVFSIQSNVTWKAILFVTWDRNGYVKRYLRWLRNDGYDQHLLLKNY